MHVYGLLINNLGGSVLVGSQLVRVVSIDHIDGDDGSGMLEAGQAGWRGWDTCEYRKVGTSR